MPEEATHKKGASSRDDQLEAIAKKREQERQEELGQEVEEPVGETEEIEEEPEEQQTPEVTPEEKDDDSLEFYGEDGTVIRVPKSAKLKTKVDGEEYEETIERISRNYQKGAAGDKRLQEAAAIKKKLEEKERELTSREKEFLEKTQQLQDNEDDLSDDDRNELAGRLTAALIDADEETAAKLLSKILPGKHELPDLDKEIESRLAKREEERRAKKWSEDVREAIGKFQREYKELAADPFLQDMVDRRTIINQQENPKASPWDIIKQSAEEVKVWVDKKVGKPPTSKPSPPTPASGRAAFKEDPKPMTREDVIAEMKRSRGQPV